MRRHPELDGLRGLCLLLMAVSHFAILEPGFGAPSYLRIGFADSAQGFVFISGITLGMVLQAKDARHGAAAVAAYCRGRVWLVWRWHAATLLLAVALSALAAAPPPMLDAAGDDALANAVLGALLIHQPAFFGVLPLYLLLIAATPLVIAGFRRGLMAAVLGTVLVLWLAAPISPFRVGYELVEGALRGAGIEGRYYQEFNVLAWQAVYVSGLAIGWQAATGRLRPSALASRQAALIAGTALCGVLIIALYRNLDLIPVAPLDPVEERIGDYQSKWLLTDLVLLDAALLAYLVAWLVAGTAASASGPVRLAGAAARAVARSRPLGLLGRNSIEVFGTHVAVVYAFGFAADGAGGTVRSALYLCAFAALFAVAAAAEWRKGARRRHRPA